MKMDLKTREYKMLCNKLEQYKKENLNENDERYYDLLRLFQKNHDEITETKKQLIELQKSAPKYVEKTFDYQKLFEKKPIENKELVVIKKENIFKRIINFIKNIGK